MIIGEMKKHKEFPININEYLTNAHKYITERFPSQTISDVIRLQMTKDKRILSVRFELNDGIFKMLEEKFTPLEPTYVVKISEEVKPRTNNSITTGKYSYEIKNQNDADDFVRFDYKPYEHFPHYHINASERIHGPNNHLEYPKDTTINLELLDCFKAINIFNAFVKDYIEGTVDNTNDILVNFKNKNPKYINKLNSGERT